MSDPISRLKVLGIFVAAVSIIIIALVLSIIETVPVGRYHIKQAAISGELTAIMKPGTYGKFFGNVEEWPVSETFDFTAPDDRMKGDIQDDSIEVRFNDGATCHIGGTCRVDLPRSEKEAIALVAEHGFRDWVQVEDKLLLPVIRRALIMTANFMSSKESYSDRRQEFFAAAWDQIENGIYVTKDEQYTDADPITGQQINRIRKVIQRGPEGGILRDKNPLQGLGIRLSNFEIKTLKYDAAVQAQISKQQEAIMAVQTAKATAQKAQQEKLTVEQQGMADVMKAKYTQEVESAKAVVIAEQEAEVAKTQAQKLVDVAELSKKTAAIQLEIATLEKQTAIEKGTGEATAKRLIIEADGALQTKLEAWGKAQEVWADAFAKRAVPGVVMGAGSGQGGDMDAQTMMQFLGVQAARQLALDLEVKTPTAPLVVPAPTTSTKK